MEVFKLKELKIRNFMGHYVWHLIDFYDGGLVEVCLFDNKEEWQKASREQVKKQ